MSARGNRIAELDDLQRRPAHAVVLLLGQHKQSAWRRTGEDRSGPVSDASTLQVAPLIGARSSGLKIAFVAERSPGVAPADAS